MKVLLIDDDVMQRGIRALILKSVADVYQADGSAGALAIVAENPTVVVICDHHLAGETGVDVVRKLRQIVPGLTIYILSGSVDLADEYAGLDVKILVKGMAPRELIALCQMESDVIDKSKFRDARHPDNFSTYGNM